jgi:hypothetical protein
MVFPVAVPILGYLSKDKFLLWKRPTLTFEQKMLSTFMTFEQKMSSTFMTFEQKMFSTSKPDNLDVWH